jgi:hypothetical protein
LIVDLFIDKSRCVVTRKIGIRREVRLFRGWSRIVQIPNRRITATDVRPFPNSLDRVVNGRHFCGEGGGDDEFVDDYPSCEIFPLQRVGKSQRYPPPYLNTHIRLITYMREHLVVDRKRIGIVSVE